MPLAFIYWDFDSDIFTIPYLDHPVRWYGLMWALGFMISQQIMYFIYKKEGRPKSEIDTLTIYMIVAAVVGARLGHVLFYDAAYYFTHPWQIVAIWEGGLASHGGTLGVIIGLYFFARKTNVAYLWIVDRIVIVGVFTGGLIRLGNLMNSEVLGVPTDLPWAFVFTRVDDVPRHPAQLYEAIYCLLIFVTFFWIWYRHGKQLRAGILTGWFLVILFSLRFVDEFFKLNQSPFEDEMLLNMGQLLSIPFVLAGIAILGFVHYRKPERQAGPENPS
jgi:prolipoprotein diacylglyceryl transferase